MIWQKGDRVELISQSYEDINLRSGDTGTVIEVIACGYGTDLRVAWDSGYECAIDAKDCVHW